MKSIHAVFANDGEWYIARCLDYPVTTQGRTLNAAKKSLQEAVALYIETWGAAASKHAVTEVYLANLVVGA